MAGKEYDSCFDPDAPLRVVQWESDNHEARRLDKYDFALHCARIAYKLGYLNALNKYMQLTNRGAERGRLIAEMILDMATVDPEVWAVVKANNVELVARLHEKLDKVAALDEVPPQEV